jgi:Tol biopolymer transport system component
MIQKVEGQEPIEIFAEEWIRRILWAPDSKELLIISGQGRQIVTLPEERVQALPVEQIRPRGQSGAWSADGSRIAFASEGAISIWNRSIQKVEQISVSKEYGVLEEIDWSPDGKGFVVIASDRERQRYSLITVSEDGNQLEVLLEDSVHIWNPLWSPDGKDVRFLRQQMRATDLMKTSTIAGSSATTRREISIPETMYGDISYSRNGQRIAHIKRNMFSNLWLANLESASKKENLQVKQLTSGTYMDVEATISPDGERIAFSRTTEEGSDIFIGRFAGGDFQQISSTREPESGLSWSPLGDFIAYYRWENSPSGMIRWRLCTVPVEGGPEREFEIYSNAPGRVCWTESSKIIVHPNQGSERLRVLDSDSGTVSELEVIGSGISDLACSYDGKRLFATGARPGSMQLWVVSFEELSTNQVNYEGRAFIRALGWSSDNKWVYLHNPAEPYVLRASGAGGAIDTVAVVSLPSFTTNWTGALAPGGNDLIFSATQTSTDVHLMENSE